MRRGVAGLGLWLVGCVGQPPAPPQDSEGSEGSTSAATVTASVGDTRTTTSPGDSTGPGSTTIDADDTSSGGVLTTDDTSTGEPVGDDALLVISDGPLYDWGPVEVGASGQHSFMVMNVGQGGAMNMAGSPLLGPYDYVGGAYPGDAGTCDDTLAVGESCLVRVSFSPPELGLHDGTLTMTHGDGSQASCALVGGGAGQSDNLLVNPGGEDLGEPPPGWTDVGAGTWMAGQRGSTPFEGNAYLAGHTGPLGQDYLLVQSADVSTWSATIDQGLMRFSFHGWARNSIFDNDDYRLRVRYLDAGGGTLGEYDTGWQGGGGGGGGGWQQYQDERVAPPGTVALEVELGCLNTNGELCNGFFDALDLHATYP